MRDFRGLLKIADLEKKADPPHRGLNDDNPAVKYVYKTYGYLPTGNPIVVGNYADPNVRPAYNSAANYAYYRVPDQKTRVASMLDYERRISPMGSYYNAQAPRPLSSIMALSQKGSAYRDINPETGYIVLGPMSNEKTLMHELGHHKDFSKRRKIPFDEPQLTTENRAWDEAGVWQGDPMRRAALTTYTPGRSIAEKLRAIDAVRRLATPDRSYVSKYTHHGIPIVHDYPSALASYDKLVDTGRIKDDLSLSPRQGATLTVLR